MIRISGRYTDHIIINIPFSVSIPLGMAILGAIQGDLDIPLWVYPAIGSGVHALLCLVICATIYFKGEINADLFIDRGKLILNNEIIIPESIQNIQLINISAIGYDYRFLDISVCFQDETEVFRIQERPELLFLRWKYSYSLDKLIKQFPELERKIDKNMIVIMGNERIVKPNGFKLP